MGRFQNWAGNVVCNPEVVAEPRTLEELRRVVAGASRLRAVGAGHTFNAQMCTDRTMVNLRYLCRVLDVDMAARRVRVEAGMRLSALCSLLDALGLALPSVGGITRQTVAGAVATGTHGSGLSSGTMSSEVVQVALVTADGDVVEAASGDLLSAARLGLGALGVVHSVTFQCAPRTDLKKRSWTGTLREAMAPGLREENLHYEIIYYPFTDSARMTAANPTDEPPTPHLRLRRWIDEVAVVDGVFGALERVGAGAPALMPLFMRLPPMLQGESTEVDTWHRSLTGRPTAFRAFDVEHAIPLDRAAEGVEALCEAIREEAAASPRYFVNLPMNIRFTGADPDVMLSPAHDGPKCYVDVPSYVGAPSPERFFRRLERALGALGGRPHWGKQIFENPSDRYPRFRDFLRIQEALDPAGKLRNPFLERLFTGQPP